MAPIKALVFDFGNVLCTWKPPKDSAIPPKQLNQIMSSDVWFDHERGRFSSEEECYAELETRFEIRSSDLASVMKMARASLKPQSTTLDFLADTKKRHPGLSIYGLTNTPRTEVDAVLSIGRRWPVFDHIYVSGNLGVRKPDICCFNTLIRSTGLPAESLVFVDDSPENVLAARSLGIHCILFQDHDQLCREIENVLGDPIERGQSFLRTNAKIMDSVTDQGVIIHDNFAQLLILDLTRDRDLVQLETWDRTWNYFIGVPQLTTEKFPNDLDTTSVALSVLPIDKKVVASVIDEMLEFRSADGIFMTYFDRTRPRVDHVVCTNILHLFCKNGRENEATATFDWVLDVLRNRAYLSGSRYYSSPDVFLYFLSRLTDVVRDQKRNEELRSLLPERIRERVGFGGDSISVATRLLASQNLGIKNDADFSRLLALQSADGGWPVGWVYKYGKSGLEIGNRGLSTALALKAIERHRVHDELPHQQPKEWWQAISFQRLWTLWPSVSRKSFSLSENLATGAHGW